MGTRKRWSPQDDAILSLHYGKLPIQRIQEMLSSQRTEKSIEMHAWTLGVFAGAPRENCRDKLLEVLKEVNDMSGDDLAIRAKIPEGSVRSAMHLLRAQGLAHVGRIVRAKRRGKISTFFIYRYGPGQDATKVEDLVDEQPAFVIPARDEITAALFGVAPTMSCSAVVGKIYQQA